MAFEGIRPVLHLPFEDAPDQSIIESELALEARTMLAEGADGVVVLGLASEAWTVTERERDRVVAIAAEASAGAALLLLSAKRQLRRRGIFSSDALRQPARGLDEREAATLDALLDELEAAGTPGFGRVAVG